MDKDERDIIVMKKVAPKIEVRKLVIFKNLLNETVKDLTTMKRFRKMNKNRRFSINLENITKELLDSNAEESDQKKFKDELTKLILEKMNK